jgi:leucyl-tRNA synthetase
VSCVLCLTRADEINILVREAVAAYKNMMFKAALKGAFYDLLAARDQYRLTTVAAGLGMHRDSIRVYIKTQALLLAPIAPHWSDSVWQEILKQKSSVTLERFPDVKSGQPALTAINDYIRSTSSAILAAEGAQQKKLAKGKTIAFDPKKEKKLTIYCTAAWPAWQSKYIDILTKQLDSLGVVETKTVMKSVDKADMKKAMPFIQGLKKKLDSGESREQVLERKLPFEEESVLKEMVPTLKATVTKLVEVAIVVFKDGEKVPPVAQGAEPGSPRFEFVNI